MCFARRSQEAPPLESISRTRTAFLMARRLGKSGRSTNARANLASNAARASGARRTAADQLTGVQSVNDVESALDQTATGIRHCRSMPSQQSVNVSIATSLLSPSKLGPSHFRALASRTTQ